LVSAEYPNRQGFLKDLIAKMSESDKLPSIEEIEKVWFEMLREITETGRVSKFSTEVATPSGEREHTRSGSYRCVQRHRHRRQLPVLTTTITSLCCRVSPVRWLQRCCS
jgi:hypothetical protein